MKKIVLPLLLSALTFGVVACTPKEDDKPAVTAKTLVKIEVSGNYKTEYHVGDTFQREGIVVTATYDDGSTKDIKAFNVTGFRSNAEGEVDVTISYTENKVTKTQVIKVTILPAAETPKQDITLKVTVSGIENYEGKTECIYINSPLIEAEGNNWGTAKLVQDAENENLWTIAIAQVEVGQTYDYDLYYGNATEPNWSEGKMTGYEADQHKSLDVVDGTLIYETTAEFNVPEVAGTVTVDLVLTGKVYESAESEGVDLAEGVYMWAWVEGLSGEQKFTKGEDGWHLSLEVELNAATGLGKIHFTAVLGTESAADWTYQMGDYNNGTWEPWGNGFTFDDIDAETTTKTYECKFNAQPTITPSEDPEDETKVNVTFNLSVGEGTLTTIYDLELGTDIWNDKNPSVGQFVDGTLTVETALSEFTFSINCSNENESITWAAIVADAAWHTFKVVLDETAPENGYTIEISAPAITKDAAYVGTVTATGATVSVAG